MGWVGHEHERNINMSDGKGDWHSKWPRWEEKCIPPCLRAHVGKFLDVKHFTCDRSAISCKHKVFRKRLWSRPTYRHPPKATQAESVSNESLFCDETYPNKVFWVKECQSASLSHAPAIQTDLMHVRSTFRWRPALSHYRIGQRNQRRVKQAHFESGLIWSYCSKMIIPITIWASAFTWVAINTYHKNFFISSDCSIPALCIEVRLMSNKEIQQCNVAPRLFAPAQRTHQELKKLTKSLASPPARPSLPV